jgi:hypothetical protein
LVAIVLVSFLTPEPSAFIVKICITNSEVAVGVCLEKAIYPAIG